MIKAGLNISNFYMPTRVVHGVDSIKQTGMLFKSLGAAKALLVTDPGVKRAGLVSGITASLAKSGVEHVLFDQVEVDPGIVTVEKGAALAQAEECDGIVVVGGGSPMCAARAMGIVIANGGELKDYIPVPKPGTKPPVPLIAIPTTAGSGSEVSQNIVLTDEELNRKFGMGSPLFFPEIAILDPMMIKSLPFHQALASGIDAFTHAIEAYLTNMSTPVTDSLALGAISLLFGNLREAATSDDLCAKEACLIGSAMANMACGNAKLGLNHTMAFPMEGMAKLNHGIVVGTLLPYTMEFNLPACRKRFSVLAGAMGREDGRPDGDAAEEAIKAVKGLYADLDFPRKFEDSLFDRGKFSEMTDSIMNGIEGLTGKKREYPLTAVLNCPNIRKATKKDVIELYERSFEGWS